MESMLKVYIYEEGEKPIFHQPLLRGIYASEGWFMKLLEANKNFVTKDATKAHLFYLPFSSQLLKLKLYARNSYNRKDLSKYLKDYVGMIALKYSFWNRISGADHFVVACHDSVCFLYLLSCLPSYMITKVNLYLTWIDIVDTDFCQH